MSFLNLDIRDEYRSLSNNVVEEFYTPILSESIIYQRAVGFFSSTALLELSRGITHLVRNGGKIQVVASPRLSEEDINAINKGIELRDEVIVKNLKASLSEVTNYFEEERLNLICNLIAKGILEVRIAIMTSSDNQVCMYHEKMGLMSDNLGNTIAFTGSMNETSTAFNYNYETIEVYKSWTHDRTRVLTKENAFKTIWNNNEPNIEVIKFEAVTEELFKKYKKNDTIDLNLDDVNQPPKEVEDDLKTTDFRLPSDLQLYDYQQQAISNWKNNDYCGIFSMATGTGKTITSLAACIELYNDLKSNLGVIIVCPYQHLVEQWVDEASLFNMKPIIGYSKSSQSNWYIRLKNNIKAFEKGTRKQFCFITTNATFATEKVQKVIKKLTKDTLIIIDEAHNFGAYKLSKTLPENIPYRIALSATINRKNDEEGTKYLSTYFKEKCIDYTIEEAIKNKRLTPYYYYPIVVSLTDDERFEYIELSKKIIKHCKFDKDGKVSISESGKMLLIQRSRIVAGAENKLSTLKRVMKDHLNDSHMLFYCGATSSRYDDGEKSDIDESEIRQIDAVVDLLGNKLGLKVAKYTSTEDIPTRIQLKDSLASGTRLQGLVAIRCLDEGVDIPSIKKAFILASSTNPKEYIQRRGRVLRKFKDKEYAEIYDFITLPYPLEMNDIPLEQLNFYKSLIKNEVDRITEFSQISLNPSESFKLINSLIENYNKIIDWSYEDE